MSANGREIATQFEEKRSTLTISPFRFSADDSDASFFLVDLMRSIENVRADDQVNAAIAYFKSAALCTHIIGSNLAYIQDSLHNRKSFVFCLHQAIQGYDESYQVAPSEFHAILDTLFPGFPWSLVLEAVHAATGDTFTSSSGPSESNQRFSVIVLSKILSFQILYEEWLKVIEDLFKGEGKTMVLNLHRLRTHMEDLQRNSGTTLFQPPFTAVVSVLDSYESSRNGGEISYQRFRSSVMTHDAVQAELNLLQIYPSML